MNMTVKESDKSLSFDYVLWQILFLLVLPAFGSTQAPTPAPPSIIPPFANVAEIPGSEAGSRFGASLLCLGNTILVGAPFKDVSTVNDVGEVYVYDAITQQQMHTLDYPGTAASGVQFGTSMAVIPDVSGDMQSDVVIGSPGANGGNGQAHTFDFDPPQSLMTVDGIQSFERLGSAVAFVGVQSDLGIPTVSFVTGSPDANSGDGRADTFPLISATPIAAFDGDVSTGEGLGASVSEVSDLNSDGFVDLAFGTPNRALGASGAQVGGVTIYSSATDQVLSRIIGNISDVALGETLLFTTDLNGDGMRDLAVGGTSTAGKGFVRIYSGASLTSTEVILCNIPAPSEAGNLFGISLAEVGDTNIDGNFELAIGDPSASAGPPGGSLNAGAGAVFVYQYNPTTSQCDFIYSLQSETNPPAGKGFGHRIASIFCNFNGDPLPDLAIGTLSDTGGNDTGSVVLLHGLPPPTPTPTPTATPTSTPQAPTTADFNFSISEGGRATFNLNYDLPPRADCLAALLARVAVADSLGKISQVSTFIPLAQTNSLEVQDLPRVCLEDGSKPVVHMLVDTICGADRITSNVFSRFMNCGVENAGISTEDWLVILRRSLNQTGSAGKKKIDRKKRRLKSLIRRGASAVQCRTSR